MTKIFSIFRILLTIAGVLLLKCCYIGSDETIVQYDGIDCLKADSAVVQQVLPLAAFNKIDLQMSGNVTVQQGSRQHILVEAPKDLINNLKGEIKDSTWVITTISCMQYRGEYLKIFVTLPTLESLQLSGSGDVVSKDVLSIPGKLRLAVNGSGSVDVAAQARQIEANIIGSGKIILQGSSDMLNTGVNGSGSLRAFGLPVQTASVDIIGSGDTQVRVTAALSVNITGSGSVYYKGKPTLSVEVTGSGRVVDAN
jgi:hypothetical protein